MRGDQARKVCPEVQLVQVPTAHGKADLTLYRDAGKQVGMHAAVMLVPSFHLSGLPINLLSQHAAAMHLLSRCFTLQRAAFKRACKLHVLLYRGAHARHRPDNQASYAKSKHLPCDFHISSQHANSTLVPLLCCTSLQALKTAFG